MTDLSKVPKLRTKKHEKGLSGNFGQVNLEKKEKANLLSDTYSDIMQLNPVQEKPFCYG